MTTNGIIIVSLLHHSDYKRVAHEFYPKMLLLSFGLCAVDCDNRDSLRIALPVVAKCASPKSDSASSTSECVQQQLTSRCYSVFKGVAK